MLTGIYRAAMGLKAELAVQDTISNNLANAATAGFKRKIPVFADSLAQASQPAAVGPAPITVADGVAYVTTSVTSFASPVDRSQGQARLTGQEYDFAIEGAGFFTLEGPGGDRIYTRAGSFHADADGDLASAQGYKVLGDQQRPISVSGSDLFVSERGDVTVDGQLRGTLLLTDLSRPDMAEQVDGGFISALPGTQSANSRVRQGYLESSNVNSVEEMVAMISCLRAYEAGQKAIASADAILGKAVNEVGRLS